MLTVSSLNTKIKSLLEATFMHITVEGEVASATYHTSGHLYFSIKDDKSTIKCVMWRSSVAKMKFRIEKGMHIVVEGSVSVYTPRGEYQFQTLKIEPYGQGALALAFEQLKEKLKAKGYFDAHRKQSIPKHIGKIALVTAKESAALHDMLKIIEKRWPLVHVYVVDTLVQGEGAKERIAQALRYADGLNVDVVVVGRGGGSVEDLWAFNEEEVADAIFAMQTPVVSAVGHEVDTLISDYVADLRAPTPSAAIEMILPDKNELLFLLDEELSRFSYAIKHQIQRKEEHTVHMQRLLAQYAPARKLQEMLHYFKQLQGEFQRTIEMKFTQFKLPLERLQQHYAQQMKMVLLHKQEQINALEQKLKLHDPVSSVKPGWVQLSKEGKRVEASEIAPGETFRVEDLAISLEAVCKKRLKR